MGKTWISLYIFRAHSPTSKTSRNGYSIVARIPRCHRGDRGSIPRTRDFLFLFMANRVLVVYTDLECRVVRVVRVAVAHRRAFKNSKNKSKKRIASRY